jgi:hypothetical protein
MVAFSRGEARMFEESWRSEHLLLLTIVFGAWAINGIWGLTKQPIRERRFKRLNLDAKDDIGSA